MGNWGMRSDPTAFCRLEMGKRKAWMSLSPAPATYGQRMLSSALTLPLPSVAETAA